MATFKRGSNNVLHVTNGRKTLRLPFGMDVYADKSDDTSIHITYKEQANKDRKAAPIKIDWRMITTPSAKTRVDMVYELQKIFSILDFSGNITDGGIEDIYSVDDPVLPLERLFYDKEGAPNFITAIIKGSGMITPGYVMWMGTGYNYYISPALYYIIKQITTSEGQTFELDPAHPTLSRIDVVALNSEGNVVIITGEPAEDPIKPQVEDVDELEVTAIFVLAGSTAPALEQLLIYDENNALTEWAGTSPDFDTDFEDDTKPFNGTYAALSTNVPNAKSIWFNAGEEVHIGQFQTLTISICLNQALTGQYTFYLAWYNGSTAFADRVGKQYALNINKTLVGEYQTFVIPIEHFTNSYTPLSELKADRLQIMYATWFKSDPSINELGFYTDYIKLESGITQPQPETHERLHDMTNPLDHAPSSVEDRNKLVASNPITGAIEFIAKPTDGEDGKTPEFRINAGWVEWRYIGDEDWIQLFELPVDGEDGLTPELRVYEGWLQWKYTTAVEWNNLFEIPLDGEDGREIELRENEGWVQWRYVGDELWINLYEIPEGGDGHSRQHSMVEELDHAPTTVDEYGKYFRYSPITGKVETVALDTILPVEISYWIFPAVDEIVAEYPTSPAEGFRIILTSDNKIYTWVVDTWVLDTQTDPLVDGSGVVIKDAPDELLNQIYYYNETEGEWLHVGDASIIDEGRFLTMYFQWEEVMLRGTRPTYIDDFHDINNAGYYQVSEFAANVPPFTGVLTSNIAIVDVKAITTDILVAIWYRFNGEQWMIYKTLAGWGDWLKVYPQEGGGGHIIQDDTDTFPQRTYLKFKSATVTDNELDDATEVEYEGGAASDDLFIPKTPSADLTARGIKTKYTAHEAQAFGDVCRINVDGKAQIANATVIATATALFMLIDATVDADAEGNYLMLGTVRNDLWTWTIGEWVYLSRTGTTGNTLTQTNVAEELDAAEDNVIQVLGVANSATVILFNPQLIQVEYRISEEE
jgi:hypothetical protein